LKFLIFRRIPHCRSRGRSTK